MKFEVKKLYPILLEKNNSYLKNRIKQTNQEGYQSWLGKQTTDVDGIKQ